ncbi:MAG TPA: prolipoprotein diacylglyceryl transferase [Thermomicrobiales bacterium]|nr:prolipoprotein diacylglyceryl transferase [Thermomicrobiales bacterium]
MPVLDDPTAFSLGALDIRWYALFILTGIFAAIGLGSWLAERRGLDGEFAFDLAPVVVISALVGARLYYIILRWDYYLDHPVEAINVRLGGLTIHGGIIAGVLAVWWYTRRRNQPFLTWTDIIAPSLALAQAIGRWGNWANQEAFGTPTDVPWAVEIAPENRPRAYAEFETFHPTFLYESIFNLLNAIFLSWLVLQVPKRASLRAGDVTGIYLIIYGVVRLFIERIRTDSLYIGPWPAAYWLSLALIFAGTGLMVGTRWWASRSTSTVEAAP